MRRRREQPIFIVHRPVGGTRPEKGAGTIETATISNLVQDVRYEVIRWHDPVRQNPELSFEETSRLVYEALESFGCLKPSRPKPPRMVARLAGGEPGRMVTLRTDMDALPITEENDFEFICNSNGVMYAHSHGGHTAMCPGTAMVLSRMKEDIQGEVCFLFWHTEVLYPLTVLSETRERA